MGKRAVKLTTVRRLEITCTTFFRVAAPQKRLNGVIATHKKWSQSEMRLLLLYVIIFFFVCGTCGEKFSPSLLSGGRLRERACRENTKLAEVCLWCIDLLIKS
jgi:hypothetical protein